MKKSLIAALFTCSLHICQGQGMEGMYRSPAKTCKAGLVLPRKRLPEFFTEKEVRLPLKSSVLGIGYNWQILPAVRLSAECRIISYSRSDTDSDFTAQLRESRFSGRIIVDLSNLTRRLR